jgi:CheY-like chemotaxis protein
MRILAVDDDEIILEILRSPTWLGADHDLVCVTSAAAALAEIDASPVPFDAFLLDVVMPERDGVSLCADIRALPTYAVTPIIMITATQELGAMQRAFDAGATDFVRKPLDGLEVGARINMACMLNKSIRREKEATTGLSDMRHKAMIAGEGAGRADLTAGAMPFLAFKNELLLLPQGLHALSLFSVRVPPFKVPKVDRSSCDILQLTLIGISITSALQRSESRVAYAAQGLFVGVTFGRRREAMDTLHKNAGSVLRKNWQDAACGDKVPNLICQPLSPLGVWSGRSAVMALQDLATQFKGPLFIDPDVLSKRLVGA